MIACIRKLLRRTSKGPGKIYNKLSPELKVDFDVVKEIAQRKPDSRDVKFVPELTDNFDVAIKMIKYEPMFYIYLSDRLKFIQETFDILLENTGKDRKIHSSIVSKIPFSILIEGDNLDRLLHSGFYHALKALDLPLL